MMLKRFVLFSVLLITGYQAHAQMPLAAGDRWTFDATNEYQGKVVTSEITRQVTQTEPELIRLEVITKSSGADTKMSETRDRNLNIVESGKLRYIPNLGLFQFPLTAGKREFAIERLQIESGRMIKMEGTVEVFPMQKTSVPAGEFDTFEIVANGRFIDPKASTSSRYQTRAWYAPKVGFFVKQENLERNNQDTANFSQYKAELKSFELQPR